MREARQPHHCEGVAGCRKDHHGERPRADPELGSVFPDGVLWASLGESPDPCAELKRWAQVLGVPSAPSEDLRECIARVRDVLENRAALLIVDDVWEVADAGPFLVAGPRSAMLFTSRFRDVAAGLARQRDEIYWLGQLEEQQGLDLLSRLAPKTTARFPKQSKRLVGDLEALPLSLRVAGRLLENELDWGWTLQPCSGHWQTAPLLEKPAPEDRYDAGTRTLPSVSALLTQSTDRLDEHTRDCFAYLGAIAPKPATFDLAAMAALWLEADPSATAPTLADRGLLEPVIGTGRFQIHALLVAHARSLLSA